jgi:CheY-like chemotaxis protein
MLSDAGYTRFKSIIDSRNALETCSIFDPDLVLLDLMMPHVDGFSILESLRANPSDIFLPVIVLTADINEETKRRALSVGATEFLISRLINSKPFFVSLMRWKRAGCFFSSTTSARRSKTLFVREALNCAKPSRSPKSGFASPKKFSSDWFPTAGAVVFERFRANGSLRLPPPLAPIDIATFASLITRPEWNTAC